MRAMRGIAGLRRQVALLRPPTSLQAAIQVAAEHVVFADEYGLYSGQSLQEFAAELVREANLALLVGLTGDQLEYSRSLAVTPPRVFAAELP